jgi:hypothetical protein
LSPAPGLKAAQRAIEADGRRNSLDEKAVAKNLILFAAATAVFVFLMLLTGYHARAAAVTRS